MVVEHAENLHGKQIARDSNEVCNSQKCHPHVLLTSLCRVLYTHRLYGKRLAGVLLFSIEIYIKVLLAL